MEIAFNSKLLRSLCECEEVANKKMGVHSAKILRSRLSDVSAAFSISDLILGKPRIICENGLDILALDIDEKYTMKLIANNLVFTDDKLDWSLVSRLKLLKIGDCND